MRKATLQEEETMREGISSNVGYPPIRMGPIPGISGSGRSQDRFLQVVILPSSTAGSPGALSTLQALPS